MSFSNVELLFRAVLVAAFVFACGVKGSPRPIQPAQPKPVAVPGQP